MLMANEIGSNGMSLKFFSHKQELFINDESAQFDGMHIP